MKDKNMGKPSSSNSTYAKVASIKANERIKDKFSGTTDEKLSSMLSMLNEDTPDNAYFENFLSEFKERQRQELLRKSSISLFWERLRTYVSASISWEWRQTFEKITYSLGGAVAALLIFGLYLKSNSTTDEHTTFANANQTNLNNNAELRQEIIDADALSNATKVTFVGAIQNGKMPFYLDKPNILQKSKTTPTTKNKNFDTTREKIKELKLKEILDNKSKVHFF